MEKFTVVTGRAVPLRRSNVDTDQIIPAEYLKRITRTGFADGLFAAWRKDPSFILNDDRYDRLTSNPCDTTKIVCPRSLCCSRYVIRFRKGSRAGLDDLSEVIVNRAELIDQIRDRLGVDKRSAENAVDVVLDTIQRAVAAGEKVAITGFGVFEKVERAARTGRNPRTGAA